MAKEDNIQFDEFTCRFYGETEQDIARWKKQYPHLDFDSVEILKYNVSQSIQNMCLERTFLGYPIRGAINPERRREVYEQVRKNPRKFLEDFFNEKDFALSSALSPKQKHKLDVGDEKPEETEPQGNGGQDNDGQVDSPNEKTSESGLWKLIKKMLAIFKRVPYWINILMLFLAALLTCLYPLKWLDPIKQFVYKLFIHE
jgi:hypothetical protein